MATHQLGDNIATGETDQNIAKVNQEEHGFPEIRLVCVENPGVKVKVRDFLSFGEITVASHLETDRMAD